MLPSRIASYIVLLSYVIVDIHSDVNLESYTERERIAIDTFRKKVQKSLYAKYMHFDYYLISWIRDKNFDLNAAEEKLLKSLKWRKENNIDKILRNAEVKAYISRNLPFTLVGRDEFNAPIIEWNVQTWQIRRQVLAGNMKKMLQLFPYFCEAVAGDIRKIRRDTGHNVTQGYAIADMFGYNLRDHGCLRCIPFFTDGLGIYENHYPGLLKYLIVANGPRIFDNMLQILKPLMSPLTRKTLKVFAIQDNIDLKKLMAQTNPKFLSRKYSL